MIDDGCGSCRTRTFSLSYDSSKYANTSFGAVIYVPGRCFKQNIGFAFLFEFALPIKADTAVISVKLSK